ncbi:MAG: hypothetical protein HQ501_11065 [Rhodospirillales bacterium]|nr:hypothetical protein [Rhodospirillales bacterium]
MVFGDQSNLFWLRLLKPGFRHCFVLLELDTGWVMLDSLAHWIHVAIIPPVSSGDLASWYRDHGYRTVTLKCSPPPNSAAPWAPFTCVETVKRALGIHRSGIWTPHQLWQFLQIGKKS